MKVGDEGEEMRVLGGHVDDVDGCRAAGGDYLDAIEQKLREVSVEGIEDIEKRRGIWKGELEGVGVEDLDVVAGVGGRVPFEEVFLRDGDQRGIEFDARDATKWIVGGEHDGSALAATDVDEDVVASGIWAVGEGAVPEGEDVEKGRGSGSPVCGDVAIVIAAGVETTSADESAGVDAVLEVERMDGVLDWEGAMVEVSAEGEGGLARPGLP